MSQLLFRRRTVLTVPAMALLFGCGARATSEPQAIATTPSSPSTILAALDAVAPFTLAALPYAYDALEPHVDARTMEIHYSRHHQGYLNNLNTAVAQHPSLADRSLRDLLTDLDALPDDVRTAIRNNGGGYLNHTLLWLCMSPAGGVPPTGTLAAAITAAFGSFDAFRDAFKAAAASQFGSGWAWLVIDQEGVLQVMSTPNQDSPIFDGMTPILGVDVWEHAYYLHYQNRRTDYLDAFFHVIDWSFVAAYYDAATA